jgi:hypothetical protein
MDEVLEAIDQENTDFSTLPVVIEKILYETTKGQMIIG